MNTDKHGYGVPYTQGPKLSARCALGCFMSFLCLSTPAWAGWTPVAERGTATEKTSDTSISVTPTATLSTGTVQLVVCATDDDGTGTGDTNQLSLSDSSTNTWTKIKEQSGTVSGASNDAVVAAWMSKLTSDITTSGSITCTSANAVTAKTIGVYEFTVGSGKTFSVVGTAATTFTGVTTAALTLSGLTSAEYLWVGAWGAEGSNTTYTEDSDYTLRLIATTTAGGFSSNMGLRAGTQVLTATSDTYDGTLGATCDGAKILAAIQEVDEGGPAPQAPLRRQAVAQQLPHE